MGLYKNKNHIVALYEYTENTTLNICKFEKMTEEWLDFIAGNISRTAFWELVKFKYPTHQIVFCTEQALKTIDFLRSYEL